MKRIFILAVTMSFLSTVSVLNFCYGQEQEQGQEQVEGQETPERRLVIREGKQSRANIVAVETYLVGNDILEVTVEARMYAQKPKINDVIMVGPRLGRIHYKTRETVHATLEEEEPIPITKQGGFIVFGKRTKTKKPKGTLTKELFKLKIPTDKIVPGKRYQLWVQVESKTSGGGRPLRFKFDLKDLPELISQ